MLAEVFAAKSHSQEAFKIYDFISSCYFKLFGTNETILNSYVEQQKAETLYKTATERI